MPSPDFTIDRMRRASRILLARERGPREARHRPIRPARGKAGHGEPPLCEARRLLVVGSESALDGEIQPAAARGAEGRDPAGHGQLVGARALAVRDFVDETG